MNKPVLFVLGIIIVLFVLFILMGQNKEKGKTPIPSPTLLVSPISTVLRTKTNGCQVQGPLPDKDCTPGAVFPDVTKEQVCTSGYSKSVRNVPDAEKTLAYEEYGITSHQKSEYEVDHYISLELGGSNDIANLWPEAANPTPGFHEKDKVENYLHSQVCSGAISLQEAQREISTDWLQVYQSIN